MTEREFQAYKEKAIAQDVLSVENRIRHAFNQGVECGRKLQTQDGDTISRQDAIAEIYEDFMTIDMAVHDKSAQRCMDILGKLPSVSQKGNKDE